MRNDDTILFIPLDDIYGFSGDFGHGIPNGSDAAPEFLQRLDAVKAYNSGIGTLKINPKSIVICGTDNGCRLIIYLLDIIDIRNDTDREFRR